MPGFRYASLMILALTAGTANAAEGLAAIKSAHDVKETMNRLEKAARSGSATTIRSFWRNGTVSRIAGRCRRTCGKLSTVSPRKRSGNGAPSQCAEAIKVN